MDVHPTKNGIYRYWPIPISKNSSLSPCSALPLAPAETCLKEFLHHPSRVEWKGYLIFFSEGGAGQQKKELQFIICAHFHIYLILFIIFYNTILLGCQWMSLLVSVWYHFPVGRKRVVSLFVSTSEGEVGRVKRANLPSLVGFKHY